MIITFFSCIIILFIVGRIFILPLKKILKLIVNSVLGGVLIYIINFCGASVGFHIGLNIGTSIFVGILGVPGAVFLIILKKQKVLLIMYTNVAKLLDFLQ